MQLGNISQTLSPETGTGTSVFGASGGKYGITSYFPFSLAGFDPQSTRFVVSGPGIQSETFAVQTNAFVVPSLTTAAGRVINASIAVLADFAPYSVQLSAPVPQQGTLGPKIVETSMAMAGAGQTAGFGLWQGAVMLDQTPTGLVGVKIMRDGDVVDMLMVNAGAAGW